MPSITRNMKRKASEEAEPSAARPPKKTRSLDRVNEEDTPSSREEGESVKNGNAQPNRTQRNSHSSQKRKRTGDEDVELSRSKALKMSKQDVERSNAIIQPDEDAHEDVVDGLEQQDPAQKRKRDDDDEDIEPPASKAVKISTQNDERNKEEIRADQNEREAVVNGQQQQNPAHSEYHGTKNGEEQDIMQPSIEEPAGMESQEEFARKARVEKMREQAKELIKHLVLLVETLRYLYVHSPRGHISEVERTQLARLCELATQAEVNINPFLTKIPVQWFGQVAKLQKAQGDTKTLEHRSQQCLDDVNSTAEAYRDAVLRRTEILLDTKTNVAWPETALEQERLACSLREELCRLKKKYASIEQRIKESRKDEQPISRLVLDTARYALFDMGLLEPFETSDQEFFPPPDADARNRVTEDQETDPADPPSISRDRSQDRQPPRPPEMKEILRGQVRDQLDQARKVLSRAVKHLDDERANYKKDLRKFLRARKNGQVLGSQEDFDHSYFMEQNRASKDITFAQDRVKYAVQEARKVGALPREELTSDFGDWSDDGYDNRSNISDPLRDLKKERIHKWRRDEEQKKIVSSSKWRVGKRARDSGGRSIAAGSGRGSAFERLGGKDRIRIDKWQAHQEKLRASSQFADLPAVADEILPQPPAWLPPVEEGRCCGI